MLVQRSQFLFLHPESGYAFSPEQLLVGNLDIRATELLLIFCCHVARYETIAPDDLSFVCSIPDNRWVETNESALTADQFTILKRLVEVGALFVKNECPTDFWRSEMQMRDDGWSRQSAFYHFATQWERNHINRPLPNDVSKLVAAKDEAGDLMHQRIDNVGPPPPHFHEVSGFVEEIELDEPDGTFLRMPLLEALRRRETTRVFDTHRTLSKALLSSQLFYTFGTHALYHVYEDVYGLKKTSPSGGCLHPTECYPLISSVEGVPAGLYHYYGRTHALRLLKQMSEGDAREAANIVGGGQVFPSTAATIFILTARFRRNYWKYNNHKKAYLVLFQDAAHLSQTNYLVAAAAGLGAFYTSAINNKETNDLLGINGFSEGALAICGIGYPNAEQFNLKPPFQSYSPFAARDSSAGRNTSRPLPIG